MGLARDLSMGPKRKRTTVGTSGDYAVLRRLTAAEAPDLAEFRATLERVAAQTGRFRPAEGRVYVAACTRYRQLSGEDYGPQVGTY